MERPPWLARIELADAGYTGCGLLVDPLLVLTWAKVLHGQTKAQVTLSDGAGPRTAMVVAANPTDGGMAVLEFDGPVDHAWAQLAPYHALHVYAGESLVMGIEPQKASLRCQAEWYSGQPTARLSFEGGPGLDPSDVLGAAVYHPRTLRVIGMVADAEARELVPTARLAELWGPLKDRIDFGPFGPHAYQELLGILLPWRPDQAALRKFQNLVKQKIPLPGEVSSVMGLAEALVIESAGLPDEIYAAMAFFMRLLVDLPGAPVQQLREWNTRHVFGGDSVTIEPAGDERTAIVVQLTPIVGDDGGHTFELKVWTAEPRGDLDLPIVSRTALSEDQVRAEVEAAIDKAVDSTPDVVDVAFIEFVLAGDWLGWPVDQWHALFDDRTPLGVSKPVTVRDLDRVADIRQLHKRVLMIQADTRGLGQITKWKSCGEPVRGEEAYKAWLRGKEFPVSLGLTGGWTHPGRISAATRSGVPVVLWSRTTCRDHVATETCIGSRFHAEVVSALANASFDTVAEQVRALRIDAAEREDDEHSGHGIILLRDDCRRRPMVLESPGY